MIRSRVILPLGPLLAFGVALVVLLWTVRGTEAADPAPAASADLLLAERSLGQADAPVTMIEFSSFTCPHCARFHVDVLPRIKEEYIAPGKLRLVFWDFPLDNLALGASALARCVDEKRYFGFLDVLFGQQAKWARSNNPAQELETLSGLAGLSKEEFQACLANRSLLEGLRKQAETARSQYKIASTPSFVINGQKVEGALTFEYFKSAIDGALAKESKSGALPRDHQTGGEDDGHLAAAVMPSARSQP